MTAIIKLKAALAALEKLWLLGDSAAAIANPAIAEMRFAIAEMEAGEPVAHVYTDSKGWKQASFAGPHDLYESLPCYTHPQPKAEPCEAGAMCLQCPDRDANEDYKRGFQDGLAELGDVMAENHCTECGTRMVDKCDVCKPKAEPVQEPVKYLLDGRRFKIHLNERMDVGCFWNFPELEGRWVALVAAEDDCHLAAAPQSATVQRELLEALRVAEDAVGDLNALEIVRAAIAKVESGAAPQAKSEVGQKMKQLTDLADEYAKAYARPNGDWEHRRELLCIALDADHFRDTAKMVEAKPLTDEQIEAVWVEQGLDDCDPHGFARAIEAAHGITAHLPDVEGGGV